MSNVHRLRLADRTFFASVYKHVTPVRRGLENEPEDWRWSSYSNFTLDEAAVAAGPIQINYIRLSEGYRA